MQLQIIDLNYTARHELSPIVHIYGKSENGRPIILNVTGAFPYFYADITDEFFAKIKSEISQEPDITGAETVLRYLPIGYQDNPRRMLKIYTDDPKNVRNLRDRIGKMEHVRSVYESDILFKNRFLVDHDIGGMSWIDVPGNTLDINDRSINPIAKESNAPLRYMGFDIECLPTGGTLPTAETSPIIMISLSFYPAYRDTESLVLVCKDGKCDRKDTIFCTDEYGALLRLSNIIQEYDPDILAGYNSNEFDIPYIMHRAEKLSVPLQVSRDNRSWYIQESEYGNKVSASGRIIIDLLPIIRSTYHLKQYTLRNVAQELLNIQKLDVETKEIEPLWNTDLPRLISYARRDAVLNLRLLLDLKILDKYIALSRASGSLIQDVINGGQSGMVESLLIREFKKNDRVIPTRPNDVIVERRIKENAILKGGAVLSPERGLIEDIVVLDYKSLYPTIMMAYNICYSSVITQDSPDVKDVIPSPNGSRFVSPTIYRGIVPRILDRLLAERMQTKQLLKLASPEDAPLLDAKQYALKILLNSFYGYSGFAHARLYSMDVANAVTSYGRENINRTKKKIDELRNVCVFDNIAFPDDTGFEIPDNARRYTVSVVYGDTDSVFVKINSDGDFDVTPDDGKCIGELLSYLNTSELPEPMEIVFESFAKRGIFLAKKRYAMWVFEPTSNGWKDRIKVRGIETVRRDWCNLTSKTMNECLRLILIDGNVPGAVSLVKNVINRIKGFNTTRDPDLFNDLILSRKYSRNIDAYKSKQPHIELIKKLIERGDEVPGIGDRVPFVVVKTNYGKITSRSRIARKIPSM